MPVLSEKPVRRKSAAPLLGCLGLVLLLPLLTAGILVATAYRNTQRFPLLGGYYYAMRPPAGVALPVGHYRFSRSEIWATRVGPFWWAFAVTTER